MKIRESYNKLLPSYQLTSLILSCISFLIFLFFIIKVESLPFYFYSLLVSAALSILIGLEYAVINYFFYNVHHTFGKLSPLFQSDQYKMFLYDLAKKLHKSWLFYLTIIIVIVPFIILELYEVWKYKYFNGPCPLFYFSEPTWWALLLDFINHIFEYFTLFLLAVIIWIMIELTFIVNELRGKYSIRVNVFDVDETGGLKPLRSFILSIVSSYFIIVTLAIISYISPTTTILFYISPKAIITYEIIILSLMLLVGVILFIATQTTIRNLIDKGVNSELQKINRKYGETCDKVIQISSSNNNDNDKELEKLRIILDTLEREETKIKEINYKRFDVKTILTFTTTILLPILTIIKEIIGFTSTAIPK